MPPTAEPADPSEPDPAPNVVAGPEPDPTGARPPHAELFIGLVAPIGTDLELVVDELKSSLNHYRCTTVPLKLSALLGRLDWAQAMPDAEAYPDTRAWLLMDAGTKLREAWGRADALALLALTEVWAEEAHLKPERADIGRPGWRTPWRTPRSRSLRSAS